MTDQRPIQHLPAPPEGTRVETGPVQFGDDWPGLFVRGDNTFDLMLRIRRLAELLANHPDPAVAAALADLTQLADAIDGGVVGTPSSAPVPSRPIKLPTREEIEARVRAFAAAKAASKPVRAEDLVGMGKNLWDSDEEFEQFLEYTRRARRGE
jgi:hypothetical protein